ncbi:hypothetical protein GIY23_18040 [Allosaccharopolyspora coralli]|uniref:Uncharacterized protein n=1 Tax=Allosaccharopolyspora coralli TaxID=2665642 RepID=A0A5Q3QK19_9PSEU|nr:hypothetical protein [Allosaccharopolyspora coralli]QGK71167.1 hypothetical protein GIY23_18040 [Allosaccharopolyspora coralli]
MNASSVSTAAASATGRATVAEVLRGLVVTGVLMSGVVHLELWAQGVAEVPVIGPLFLLNAVAGIVLGLVVPIWRHWIPVAAACLFNAATLLAFVLAVTVGLFGSREVAAGVPQSLAGVAEVVSLLCGLALLLVGSTLRR